MNVILSVGLEIILAPRFALITGQYISILFCTHSGMYFINLLVFVAEFRSSVTHLFCAQMQGYSS